jgi:molecular chaperone DnaK (HSP70)
MIAYSWTKLLLDENTPLTRYDDATLENASVMGILKLPKDKDAIQVVSDFLSEVYKHILKMIAKQITEEALRITPLEFWFTVPAIWSDRAKDATRKAAEIAGFGNSHDRREDTIFMITEPEAAAIAALKKTTIDGLGASVKVSNHCLSVFRQLTAKVQPGDGVLVCDCGGGTVVCRTTPSPASDLLQ